MLTGSEPASPVMVIKSSQVFLDADNWVPTLPTIFSQPLDFPQGRRSCSRHLLRQKAGLHPGQVGRLSQSQHSERLSVETPTDKLQVHFMCIYLDDGSKDDLHIYPLHPYSTLLPLSPLVIQLVCRASCNEHRHNNVCVISSPSAERGFSVVTLAAELFRCWLP